MNRPHPSGWVRSIHPRHTVLAVSTEAPPVILSKLLFLRDNQSEDISFRGRGAVLFWAVNKLTATVTHTTLEESTNKNVEVELEMIILEIL